MTLQPGRFRPTLPVNLYTRSTSAAQQRYNSRSRRGTTPTNLAYVVGSVYQVTGKPLCSAFPVQLATLSEFQANQISKWVIGAPSSAMFPTAWCKQRTESSSQNRVDASQQSPIAGTVPQQQRLVYLYPGHTQKPAAVRVGVRTRTSYLVRTGALLYVQAVPIWAMTPFFYCHSP